MLPVTLKIFVTEIALIQQFYHGPAVELKFDNSNILSASLEKNNSKGFLLKGSGSGRFDKDAGDRLTGDVGIGDIKLLLTDSFLSNCRDKITNNIATFDFTINVQKMSTASFDRSNKGYFRSIFPLKKAFDFFFVLDDTIYETASHSCRGLVKVSINNKSFEVLVHKKDDKAYLLIDCIDEIEYKEFSDIEWSLSVGLGYICGILAQDDGFTFRYDTQDLNGYCDFKYSQRRASIKSFYQPVFSNPFGLPNSEMQAHEFRSKVKNINTNQLSAFIQLIHGDDDIKAMILLVMESLSSSLLLMPVGLSVVLEGLSEYYSEKYEEVLKPVSDKKIAQSFRKELSQVLEKYKAEHLTFNWDIIKHKLDNINSPTNKERLKAPFTILEIPLTEADEKILDYRNDFLHGNVNMNAKNNNRNYEMDTYEIAMRLLTLINMIIMKMIGYNGYIVNHAKCQLNIESEKLYREV